jgi:hypothetical protein
LRRGGMLAPTDFDRGESGRNYYDTVSRLRFTVANGEKACCGMTMSAKLAAANGPLAGREENTQYGGRCWAGNEDGGAVGVVTIGAATVVGGSDGAPGVGTVTTAGEAPAGGGPTTTAGAATGVSGGVVLIRARSTSLIGIR